MRKIIWILVFAGFLFSWNLSAEQLVHIVSRGETIFSISRFYRVSESELMRLNGITDPSKLQAGRRLMIPSSAFSDFTVPSVPGQPSVPAQPPAPAPAPALMDYRVIRGDTLWSIARNNGITVQNLRDINRFSQNHVIRAGDTIKVPARAAQPTPQITPPAQPGNMPPRDGLFALRWPVNPREITYMTGQMGVVVDGEFNESVRSLTSGRVISAGPWRKYGKVAIVEAAGGYFYMYGGCETLSVNVGDRISVGAEIGRLGINTVSEKPQLFFMVFRNDVSIDPARAPRAGGNLNI